MLIHSTITAIDTPPSERWSTRYNLSIEHQRPSCWCRRSTTRLSVTLCRHILETWVFNQVGYVNINGNTREFQRIQSFIEFGKHFLNFLFIGKTVIICVLSFQNQVGIFVSTCIVAIIIQILLSLVDGFIQFCISINRRLNARIFILQLQESVYYFLFGIAGRYFCAID